ncbi:uncharacterized protein LOC134534022 [Bacillus rossius redtenbacheri]|uniref:uncharacterized protein LOC134534022 n=1 Tax=Bacillus rossius redtenbacheri TaxID=93214 RepID=UPI002FDE0470
MSMLVKRCENGSATRASCGEGQRFSAARGACCPAGDVWCVRPLCAGDEGAFAEPGSRCRAYYRCRAGRASQLACPAGAAFSARDQECVAGAAREPCYELLCTGRVNGDYADSSHGCRRSFRCEGGEVRAVRGCPAGSLHDGRACRPAAEVTCPPPHASAVALPADDCAGLPDGPRPAAGCRVYRLCRGGRTLATLRWEGAPCPPPAPADPCAGRADGLGPDYASGCGAHVRCGGGALLARLRCEGARVFDGSACVAEGDFSCEGPEPWLGCAALADGLHADLGPDSRCRRYFLCHRGNRTRLACPRGQVFDGRSCVPAGDYRCPALPQDACQDKPDGYYRDADSGCRSYFFCSNGHKITYLCAGSYVFDGTECVAPDAYECPFSSEDCVGRANGYHAAAESDCRKYYYCLDGDKITTLMCDDDKVFDGRRCVDPSVFQCTIPYSADAGVCHGRSDGWFADFNNGCRNYFQCIGGRKAADASCPDGKVFDSSSCVDARTYSGM